MTLPMTCLEVTCHESDAGLVSLLVLYTKKVLLSLTTYLVTSTTRCITSERGHALGLDVSYDIPNPYLVGRYLHH